MRSGCRHGTQESRNFRVRSGRSDDTEAGHVGVRPFGKRYRRRLRSDVDPLGPAIVTGYAEEWRAIEAGLAFVPTYPHEP